MSWLTGGPSHDVDRLLALARGPQALPDPGPMRQALLLSKLRGEPLRHACAAVDRAVRERLGLQPYPTQWMAALALLRARLAEVATGEGKTLSMALAATVAALAGRRVHVVTGNDYLVGRDATAMQPLFAHFGLTVAAVQSASGPRARKIAHSQDIVYLTGRELVFDALRDEQAAGAAAPLQRSVQALAGDGVEADIVNGFDTVLIDEADSVLLDEAQVPFVLSRPVPPRQHDALLAGLSLARELQRASDFELSSDGLSARLTEAGRDRIMQRGANHDPPWANLLHRDESIERALVALHGLRRDRDYLVRDDQVTLIDTVTGRQAHGRLWSHGLHALVAAKEGCTPPSDSQTVARTTYPEFFRRYRHVAGLSASLWVAKAELRRLYGLRVVRIPPFQPCRRLLLPTRVFRTDESRREAVVERVCALADHGRPVLVGTDTVAESNQLAARLRDTGREAVVLNAVQDAHEASIVAAAGRAGRITVATNMAGRGTDIVLTPEAAAAGGLHVLSCQAGHSRRLDVQLAGRCARRGEPGSAEFWLVWPQASRDGTHARKPLHIQLAAALAEYLYLPQRWAAWLARRPQRLAESEAALQRRSMLEGLPALEERLGFARKPSWGDRHTGP